MNKLIFILVLLSGCTAVRTIEECEFSCTDCKEVQFRCPTDSKSVDMGVPDIAIPKP